jgi:hypothetical protein
MEVCADAPVRFLNTAYNASAWVAIFLKSYESSRVAQRVGPLSWIRTGRSSDGCRK